MPGVPTLPLAVVGVLEWYLSALRPAALPPCDQSHGTAHRPGQPPSHPAVSQTAMTDDDDALDATVAVAVAVAYSL